MNRRRFLGAVAASSLLGLSGVAGANPAQINGSGSPFPRLGPRAFSRPRLTRSRYKVLEIFLTGAASHRDSLWVEQLGSTFAPPRQVFDDDSLAPIDTNDALLASDRYIIGANPGASDESICLGPWAKVLEGTDWRSRARLVTMGHDRPVHRLAQFHALTGQTLGRDGAACMGAWLSNDTWSTNFPSFVLAPRPNGVPHALLPALRTTNDAPVAPVLVPFSSSGFAEAVSAHAADPNRESVASIRSALRGDYSAGLQHTSGLTLRSAGHSSYEGAVSLMDLAPELEELLGSAQLTLTGSPSFSENHSRLAARFAAELLASSAGPRHVCILDGGITTNFDHHGKGYFVNEGTEQSSQVNASLYSLFRELVGVVDLDETVVVVHTDFGRVWLSSETTGHWSEGYASLVIGGPIGTGQGGVVGEMTYEASDPDLTTIASFQGGPALSPSDLRAALLQVSGSSMVEAAVPRSDLQPLLGDHDAVFQAIFGRLS